MSQCAITRDWLVSKADALIESANALMPTSACRVGTAILVSVIALMGFFAMFLNRAPPAFSAFIVSIAVVSIIWHVYLAKGGDVASTNEHFYHGAPHAMVVANNPVFAHEADDLNSDDARPAPWNASEAEVEGAIRQMQELTPPELLEAAQNNAVDPTLIETYEVSQMPVCRFPRDFSELGERLG